MCDIDRVRRRELVDDLDEFLAGKYSVHDLLQRCDQYFGSQDVGLDRAAREIASLYMNDLANEKKLFHNGETDEYTLLIREFLLSETPCLTVPQDSPWPLLLLYISPMLIATLIVGLIIFVSGT